jgi:hypothetical protein
MSRTRTVLIAALAVVTVAGVAPSAGPAAAAAPAALTNLAHLDWLRDEVDPPTQPGHTTYQEGSQPAIGVLWTYAEPRDGVWTRVGGGSYDPATDTYGQGAFNADDVSRAAVVYLRHWQQTEDAGSRAAAYDLLRGLAYLQTATGPDAGNVVLWMQPDGTLNPSAEPVELPDPSDSGPSYWLARTLWAFGEGYAAFRRSDPAFAAFLADRFDLARAAVDRQVLDGYGDWLRIDGERAPAWLVVDGADATAEAVLGLAAYAEATGDRAAARTLDRLSRGVAALSDGDADEWPFGALRPWALSRSVWHAWGTQMGAALARASGVLDDDRLLRPAVRDAAVFQPWLLTSGGPDNGRLPTPTDRVQIAYGADSRVQSLLAVADETGRRGLADLAGISAAWFFGANRAGVAAYDPATGRTIDGIEPDGRVNRNSGAESTIHGLLTMLQLDERPRVRELAQTATVVERLGAEVVEAESGALRGGATVVTPAQPWTGEALWSGQYVRLPRGSSVQLAVPTPRPSLVLPVLELRPGARATSEFRDADGRRLGSVRSGDVGPQGDSPAVGALLPTTLTRPTGADSVTARTIAAPGHEARLDALLVEPVVSHLVLGGDGGTAVLRSSARTLQMVSVAVPGGGRAAVSVYDATGDRRWASSTLSDVVRAPVLPGGFTLVVR